ncbi:hypothetical protein BDV93DRAFT_289987 [Ceratobasidium sp. AG-I]|nr:hypothetical protein BDV93DRAFT_289987 [Ceratobasidium sp. AG-I]
MLITGKYGYKVGDIRILAEGLGTKTRPTRKNILKYLDWLVEAREQDHRFLHFSGHGTYFEATAETGKEAVVIDPKKTSGDNELDENKWRRTNDYQRIQYLDKSKVEMKYYQEAIVTSYVEDYDDELDELDDPNKHGLERLKKYVVYDKELNARMSKLPPGCKITCVFDTAT